MAEDKNGKKLTLRYDPSTIEHLGIKMYSRLPNALAELIANAYDADASTVCINLYDEGDEKKIVVQDDGTGMTFDQIQNEFLVIGRNRREQSPQSSQSPGGRKITGKKGLGKLALFGIGQTIEITTTTKDSKQASLFELDWEKIKKKGVNAADNIPHKYLTSDEHEQGTTITLKNLKRQSKFDLENLKNRLGYLFTFFDDTEQADFKCYIQLNDGEKERVKYDLSENTDIEGEGWDIKELSHDDDYERKGEVVGRIFAGKLPLKPALKGISLFAKGRMVNSPSFFGRQESSHVFSYITGKLDVSFIDDMPEDMISTNRQSLNWEEQEMKELQEFLRRIVRKVEVKWSEMRKKDKKEIGYEKWLATMPSLIAPTLKIMLETVYLQDGVAPNIVKKIFEHLQELFPPHPLRHFRELHDEIQSASDEYYHKKLYHAALREASKVYLAAVKEQLKILGKQPPASDSNAVSMAFAIDQSEKKPIVSVTSTYPNQFGNDTLDNIQDGQHYLSKGMVAGFRNPLGHEADKKMREAKLLTDQDCLDGLSILSHLFKRLDKAKKTK